MLVHVTARSDSMRVIVVDDAWLVRDGIARLLADDGMDVIGQLADATDLLAQAGETDPDVVIVDVRMPPTFTTEGLQAALELKRELPKVGVLVLSQHVETRHALDLLAGGHTGVGYLLKQRIAKADELLSAVQRVASGGTAIDPEVVRIALTTPRRVDPLERLTTREREVLALLAEGLSNERIAALTGVNGRTVETHTSRIFSKLGLDRSQETHRRVLAVLTHLRSGTDGTGRSPE
jgi:DNA-binding NarL/FixJ family response regulator